MQSVVKLLFHNGSSPNSRFASKSHPPTTLKYLLFFKNFPCVGTWDPCVKLYFKYVLPNSLRVLCLKKWTFKFPYFAVPWPPCLNVCLLLPFPSKLIIVLMLTDYFHRNTMPFFPSNSPSLLVQCLSFDADEHGDGMCDHFARSSVVSEANDA